MKNFKLLLLLSFICLAFASCGSDDDNPVDANAFKIGTNNYPLARGFRVPTELDAPNLFFTSVALVSNGLTLDANEELAGTGNLVVFEFYTATNSGLQAGTYTLDEFNYQAQTVYAYTGVGYNGSTGNSNIEDDIFQGTITVEVLANGNYKITGQGIAEDAGAAFTVNYTGAIQLVN